MGLPVNVTFCAAIILVAVGNRYLNDYITNSAPNKTPSVYIMQVPTILYVGSTVGLDFLYWYVAKVMVDQENHRTQQTYDSSLSRKRFSFDFVNNYIALYFLAFWNRSLA